MRKVILSLIFSCLSLLLIAQKKDSININQGIPFAIVEKTPVLPGCEKLSEGDRRGCLQNGIRKHISQNFNMSVIDNLSLEPGALRLYFQFLIGKDGNIYNIKSRGIHKKIEEEGIRVVSTVPKMTPGVHHGREVNVKYTKPVKFFVEDKSRLK